MIYSTTSCKRNSRLSSCNTFLSWFQNKLHQSSSPKAGKICSHLRKLQNHFIANASHKAFRSFPPSWKLVGNIVFSLFLKLMHRFNWIIRNERLDWNIKCEQSSDFNQIKKENGKSSFSQVSSSQLEQHVSALLNWWQQLLFCFRLSVLNKWKYTRFTLHLSEIPEGSKPLLLHQDISS